MGTKEFIGCGKVVWGNEEFGELNCGDPMGRWEKDESGELIWINFDYYKCEDCSQKDGGTQ